MGLSEAHSTVRERDPVFAHPIDASGVTEELGMDKCIAAGEVGFELLLKEG